MQCRWVRCSSTGHGFLLLIRILLLIRTCSPVYIYGSPVQTYRSISERCSYSSSPPVPRFTYTYARAGVKVFIYVCDTCTCRIHIRIPPPHPHLIINGTWHPRDMASSSSPPPGSWYAYIHRQVVNAGVFSVSARLRACVRACVRL